VTTDTTAAAEAKADQPARNGCNNSKFSMQIGQEKKQRQKATVTNQPSLCHFQRLHKKKKKRLGKKKPGGLDPRARMHPECSRDATKVPKKK